MPRAASVPIVSQTEIDPMKTAFPACLALSAHRAPELKPGGPGGPCPHGCTRTQGPADAIGKPSNGKWPWGGRRAAAIVCAAGMKADGFDGRF